MNKQYLVEIDKHSIYIKFDGIVFRPVDSTWSILCHNSWGHTTMKTTKIKSGDLVECSKITNTANCRINKNGIYEIWQCHGVFEVTEGRNKRSIHCWCPREQKM